MYFHFVLDYTQQIERSHQNFNKNQISMKFKSCLLALAILFISNGFASPTENDPIPRPKLVVGIMVDQMRWDYLYRYYERYGSDGFKRILKEGFSNENTYIDYIPTVTGIGHSTVYTGSVPAIHGITGNSITFNTTGETVNCVGDATVESVGTTSDHGKRSPVNMLSNTIGDELKLATNFRSKVIGISLKDRGAILPAGHAADAAYWFEAKTGKWVSSTYYMDKLPKWVDNFNDRDYAKRYLKKDWNTLYDIKTYTQSTADNKPYEGTLKGQDEAVFPVKTSKLFSKDDYSVIYTTPHGNSILLDFAKETIDKEDLGRGDDTDLLAISLSSTDAIGHTFGVNSVEVEDTYLRLDKDLGAFFKHLDQKIGKGNYTIFLTADHGANHNPQFLHENKLPVHTVKSNLKDDLNLLLQKNFQVDGLVSSTGYNQVRFNYKLIEEHQLDEQKMRDICMKYLRRNPEVLFVADFNKIGDASIPEQIKQRMINSHHPERTGGIHFIFNADAKSLTTRGSGHSVWNPDDARIPMLWMGWGIKNGKSSQQAHMTDIAPTLAYLLKIQVPNGSIGKVLSEVLIEE